MYASMCQTTMYAIIEDVLTSDGKPVQNQGCYEYKSSNTDFSQFAVAAPIGGVTYQTCINYCQGKSTPYAYAAVTGGPVS